VRGDIVAEGNHCSYGGAQQPVAVLLQGSALTASSNRVRGGDSMLLLRVDPKMFAAVGNLAPGGTHLGNPGNGLPAPWQPLNPTV
jgi:hypothetical protein